MPFLRSWFTRFLGLHRRERRDSELNEELQAHLDLLTAENVRRGMRLEEARYATRREFAGVEQTKETYREQRGLPFVDTLLQEARLSCGQADAAFFPTLAIQPILGRNFTREEDRPTAPRVALLSYGLWRSRFASDRGIVGRNVSPDGKPVLIIGVLPADFEMPTRAMRVDPMVAFRYE